MLKSKIKSIVTIKIKFPFWLGWVKYFRKLKIEKHKPCDFKKLKGNYDGVIFHEVRK